MHEPHSTDSNTDDSARLISLLSPTLFAVGGFVASALLGVLAMWVLISQGQVASGLAVLAASVACLAIGVILGVADGGGPTSATNGTKQTPNTETELVENFDQQESEQSA